MADRSTPATGRPHQGWARWARSAGVRSGPDLSTLRAFGGHWIARWTAVSIFVSVGLTILAATLWWANIGGIDEARISDVGLITALPAGSILAPIILAAGFIVAVTHRRFWQGLLTIDLVLLVLMLHGVTSMIQEAPGFSTTYVHAGFVEAIMRTGQLFVDRDARFSWPVFFILGAFLTSIAGLDSPLQLTSWIPAVSNLLYLIPLFMILRAFTADRRIVWFGLWIFVMANWVGQDYFSPQGFNVFLYLTAIAILTTWFRTGYEPPLAGLAKRVRRLVRSPHPEEPADLEVIRATSLDRRGRAGLVLVLVLLAGVVVASHQLTPFALLGATSVLVVTRQTQLRGYPLLVAILLGTWLSYMTLGFLAGHISSLLADALQAEAVAGAAVGDHLRGNPGHTFIVYERIVFAATFWGIAFLGVLRQFWNGHWDLTLALLAGFPFGFLALQSYGGEILLRVYLFALPFMCFFVAGFFFPRLRPTARLQSVLMFGLSAVLIVGFLFARFGNDRADLMTADEVAAVERISVVVPAGSIVATANHNSPYGYRDYDRYTQLSLTPSFVSGSVTSIANAIGSLHDSRPVYVFLSRSQEAYFDLIGFPSEQWQRLVGQLETSPSFRLVFRTHDTVLYEYLRTSSSRAP